MSKKNYYLLKDNDSFNIKEELAKYARNWPWFVVTIVLFLSLAFVYLRYAPIIYKTSGKIKILDDSSKAIELPGDISSLFESSKVNLENEIEVIKSHHLLKRVVTNLNLNITYTEVGNIKSKELWDPPFKVFPLEDIEEVPIGKSFTIIILPSGYQIIQSETKHWHLNKYTINTVYEDLPFIIKSVVPSIKKHIGKEYKIVFNPISKTTAGLSSRLKIAQVGKNSDILSLSMTSDCKEKSEVIINEVINQFNLDGILDRQLVSQRTIDFVDARFEYLTKELDSIENNKKGFKQNNNLSDIGLDTEYTIVRQANTQDEVTKLETQLEISEILRNTLKKQNIFSLLPANIGLENPIVNNLINEYNAEISYHNKIIESAGENNPITVRIEDRLKGLKTNILNSLITFENQTKMGLKRIRKINKRSNNLFSGIPQKAQKLRAIERQQKIKETLYILLLERREQASINLAVTSPSIKVVDYAITNATALSPKRGSTFLIAFLWGIILPFIVFYILFLMDYKIHKKEDILSVCDQIPVNGEIPFSRKSKLIKGKGDRSVLSEAFRVLRTNVTFFLKEQLPNLKRGKVIYVTSSIKGEGKTFTAVNLALSYLNLSKKVILIGGDFRNPQIHTYFNFSRSNQGLSDYLKNPIAAYKDFIEHTTDAPGLDIILSGTIFSNPDELLSNGFFEALLSELKKEYDYIIVDTAPTILVTDTTLMAPYADAVLYVIRSRFTSIKLLSYSKELVQNKRLNNVTYVLNGLTPSRLYGYNYNYGYNYGYHTNLPIPWYKRLFKKYLIE